MTAYVITITIISYIGFGSFLADGKYGASIGNLIFAIWGTCCLVVN